MTNHESLYSSASWRCYIARCQRVRFMFHTCLIPTTVLITSMNQNLYAFGKSLSPSNTAWLLCDLTTILQRRYVYQPLVIYLILISQASSGAPLIAAAIQPSNPQYVDAFCRRYPDWSTELSQLNTCRFCLRWSLIFCSFSVPLPYTRSEFRFGSQERRRFAFRYHIKLPRCKA